MNLHAAVPPMLFTALRDTKTIYAVMARQEATEWLMKRMKKCNGKWTFTLSDEGSVSKDRKKIDTERFSAGHRSVPRFIAVQKAGGEAGLKQAIAAGEIVPVKGHSGKTLYRWEEESSSKGGQLETMTSLHTSDVCDGLVMDSFGELWISLSSHPRRLLSPSLRIPVN